MTPTSPPTQQSGPLHVGDSLTKPTGPAATELEAKNSVKVLKLWKHFFQNVFTGFLVRDTL